MSCAIVSSSIGCKGIEVTEDQDISIADNPENFARNIVGLWRDNAPQKNDEKARQMGLEKYSWKINCPNFRRCLSPGCGRTLAKV
jgi:hypothetical protein